MVMDTPGEQTVEMADHESSPPTLLRDLFGWYSITLLALGMRSGLLDALVAGPATAGELAERAGVDSRNVHEWARGMTAGGHASHDRGTFTLSPETAQILGPGFPADLRAVLAFTQEVPSVFDQVVDAMRSGKGVPYDAYREIGAAAGRVNTPAYAAALVPEWIQSVPGLHDRLQSGGAVADLAAGNGDAGMLVARAYPATRVVGYDLSSTSRDDLPDNLRMCVADARDLPDDGPFDLVYCLDSFHHLGDPAPVLARARKVLAPHGVLMIVEAGMSGDVDEDVADPFSVVVYACGLMYCLQENLHAGGGAHSNADGPGWIVDALLEAGFASVDVNPSPTGFAVITASSSALEAVSA
jgi:SAM-dependent methyltransferase